MWDTPRPSTCGCSKAGVRPRSSTSAVSRNQITNFKTCLQNQSELKKWSCLTRKPGLGKKFRKNDQFNKIRKLARI